MKQADQVIIVPGYGMAVSQAQHALREMADLLKARACASNMRSTRECPGREPAGLGIDQYRTRALTSPAGVR